MKTITKEWLEYAKTDLRNCEHIIEDEAIRLKLDIKMK